MKRDVPEYSTGNVEKFFFLLWADINHMVAILCADQQLANVAAVVLLFIFIFQQAQSKFKAWLGY